MTRVAAEPIVTSTHSPGPSTGHNRQRLVDEAARSWASSMAFTKARHSDGDTAPVTRSSGWLERFRMKTTWVGVISICVKPAPKEVVPPRTTMTSGCMGELFPQAPSNVAARATEVQALPRFMGFLPCLTACNARSPSFRGEISDAAGGLGDPARRIATQFR